MHGTGKDFSDDVLDDMHGTLKEFSDVSSMGSSLLTWVWVTRGLTLYMLLKWVEGELRTLDGDLELNA